MVIDALYPHLLSTVASWIGCKKVIRFLVSARVASLLWNDVQLQQKLLDRLEFCCALTTFSQRGMNICLICEASLSHHTSIVYGKLDPRVYNVSRTSLLAKKSASNDQKPETFLLALSNRDFLSWRKRLKRRAVTLYSWCLFILMSSLSSASVTHSICEVYRY